MSARKPYALWAAVLTPRHGRCRFCRPPSGWFTLRAFATSAVLCLALLTACRAVAIAQDTVFFPPPNRIAVRDMRAVSAVDLSDRVHIRTIVGPTSSVSVGELDSGAVVPAHHHTREQADITLRGQMTVTLGSHVAALPMGVGVLIPIDVTHSLENPGPGRTLAIEFHTVPRPDLVPPRTPITFPSAAVDAPVGDVSRLIARMNADSGATLDGSACEVRWRTVRTAVDVHPAPTPTEWFVYVARGMAEVEAAGASVPIREGMLLMVPASMAHVRLRAVGNSEVNVIEFHVRPHGGT